MFDGIRKSIGKLYRTKSSKDVIVNPLIQHHTFYILKVNFSKDEIKYLDLTTGQEDFFKIRLDNKTSFSRLLYSIPYLNLTQDEANVLAFYELEQSRLEQKLEGLLPETYDGPKLPIVCKDIAGRG